MKFAPLALAASLALVTPLAAAAPAAAVGTLGPVTTVTPDRLFNYDTSLAPQDFGAGAYDGRLRLTISSAGIVSGTYQPEDTTQLRIVTGGVSADKIWLDLGAGLHIDGTIHDGAIVGYTFLGQLYRFDAKPVG